MSLQEKIGGMKKVVYILKIKKMLGLFIQKKKHFIEN